MLSIFWPFDNCKKKILSFTIYFNLNAAVAAQSDSANVIRGGMYSA